MRIVDGVNIITHHLKHIQTSAPLAAATTATASSDVDVIVQLLTVLASTITCMKTLHSVLVIVKSDLSESKDLLREQLRDMVRAWYTISMTWSDMPAVPECVCTDSRVLSKLYYSINIASLQCTLGLYFHFRRLHTLLSYDTAFTEFRQMLSQVHNDTDGEAIRSIIADSLKSVSHTERSHVHTLALVHMARWKHTLEALHTVAACKTHHQELWRHLIAVYSLADDQHLDTPFMRFIAHQSEFSLQGCALMLQDAYADTTKVLALLFSEDEHVQLCRRLVRILITQCAETDSLCQVGATLRTALVCAVRRALLMLHSHASEQTTASVSVSDEYDDTTCPSHKFLQEHSAELLRHVKKWISRVSQVDDAAHDEFARMSAYLRVWRHSSNIDSKQMAYADESSPGDDMPTLARTTSADSVGPPGDNSAGGDQEDEEDTTPLLLDDMKRPMTTVAPAEHYWPSVGAPSQQATGQESLQTAESPSRAAHHGVTIPAKTSCGEMEPLYVPFVPSDLSDALLHVPTMPSADQDQPAYWYVQTTRRVRRAHNILESFLTLLGTAGTERQWFEFIASENHAVIHALASNLSRMLLEEQSEQPPIDVPGLQLDLSSGVDVLFPKSALSLSLNVSHNINDRSSSNDASTAADDNNGNAMYRDNAFAANGSPMSMGFSAADALGIRGIGEGGGDGDDEIRPEMSDEWLRAVYPERYQHDAGPQWPEDTKSIELFADWRCRVVLYEAGALALRLLELLFELDSTTAYAILNSTYSFVDMLVAKLACVGTKQCQSILRLLQRMLRCHITATTSSPSNESESDDTKQCQELVLQRYAPIEIMQELRKHLDSDDSDVFACAVDTMLLLDYCFRLDTLMLEVCVFDNSESGRHRDLSERIVYQANVLHRERHLMAPTLNFIQQVFLCEQWDFFFTNDIFVLMDLLLRKLFDAESTDETLLMYVQTLHSVLCWADYPKHCYKLVEVIDVLTQVIPLHKGRDQRMRSLLSKMLIDMTTIAEAAESDASVASQMLD
jgi:SPIN90/Ldb17, leucine-rich domain